MALSHGLYGMLLEGAQAAVKVIQGAQTEILVFMIAVVMHTLVFGKRSVRAAPGAGVKVAKPVGQRCPGSVAPKKVSASSALVCLKAAVGSCNLDGALTILRAAAKPWRADLSSPPSSGHRFIVRSLLQLAVEQGKVTLLLDELSGCGLLGGWAAECLLEEANKQGFREALEAILDCMTADGVKLGSTTHCALICSTSGATASRVLMDALEQHGDCPDVVATAVSVALARGDKNAATLAFAKLPAKPSAELGAAAVKLVAEGLVEGQTVLQLFEERLVGVDLLHDFRAARLVADAVLKARRLDLLKELLATSSGACQASLLKGFGAEGRLRDAQEVFKSCSQKTACLHNALLDLYVDAGEMFAAETVMTSATKAGLADATTYNTVIKAHLQRGDIHRARCAIETMRSVGLAPNGVCFNDLIEAAFKSDPEAVWGLIDEMKACRLTPSHMTCCILLKNVQRTTSSADVQRSLDAVDSMAEDMDEALLSSICEACIRSGQADLLRQQLIRHRSEDAFPVRSAHAFGSIIRAYGFLQDLEGIWTTWTEMRNRHISPTSITLGCMVEALVSNDSPEAGYSMIAEMLSSKDTRPLVNAVSYCSVLKGFIHQKQFNRVWQIYGEMKVHTKALSFSVSTYNLLIDACARSSDMARVPGLLKEMSSQQIQPNVITYSTIVKGYVQDFQLDKAFEMVEDMKKDKKFKPDEIAYNTLLDGCARYGYYERGIAVLQDMQEAGVPPSNFTLSLLVKLATRAHRPEMAFQLCTDISQKYKFKLNAHVYNNLINTCVSSNDNDRAMDVFLQSLKERVRPDARTYTLLLRAALAGGDAHAAAGLLRAAHGKSGVHPALASFDKSMLQVKGGLPSDVTQEILEGISRPDAHRDLAAKLKNEMKHLPYVKLNPRLTTRPPLPAA